MSCASQKIPAGLDSKKPRKPLFLAVWSVFLVPGVVFFGCLLEPLEGVIMQVNLSPKADAVLQLEPSNRKTLVGRLREVTAADVLNADIKKFRQVWTECGGPGSPSARLLTEPNGNAKANKSKRPEYILHLAPERTAGVGNVCQYSTRGCRKVCLFYSGRASVWAKINAGRIAKTRAAFEYPAGFLAMLRAELFALSAAGVGSRELRSFGWYSSRDRVQQ